MCMFRKLRADEIECRVGTQTAKGVSLLLYKDARCDMNILDETVGAFNWKREHTRENANCIVSIWDEAKSQWISKEDTGTESKTEAEKGLASDSFKRACFNWGIGRELYTAPFIWVSEVEIANNRVVDKFIVRDIGYNGEVISYLVIANKRGKIVYTYGSKPASAPTVSEESVQPKAPISAVIKQTTPVLPTGDDIKLDRRTIWNGERDRLGLTDAEMVAKYAEFRKTGLVRTSR